MRTQGKWYAAHDGEYVVKVKEGHQRICIIPSLNSERLANANTISLAGNTANEIDKMGFDGDAAIGPELSYFIQCMEVSENAQMQASAIKNYFDAIRRQ